MKAVTNGKRIEITGLNNNELNFDLSEAVNLNGGSLLIETRRNRRE